MEKAVVFFDGICNLCNNSIQKIIQYDKNNQFVFTSLQSAYTKKIKKDSSFPTSDSIILLKNNKFYIKSGAVLRICAYLSFPYKLAAVLLIIPSFIRNPVYDFIAVNRYRWYGKRNACMVPDDALKEKFLE